MTQDERWIAKRKEVMDFMEKNHRNLSHHHFEEHDMFNWVKANRKFMIAGELKE
jgi:hypothetical protein